MALCFRFENFDVPAVVRRNTTVRLICSYDLEGEELYSVKWFKDQKEVYRYMPSEIPEIQYFRASGVFINVSANTVIKTTNYIHMLRRQSKMLNCEIECWLHGRSVAIPPPKSESVFRSDWLQKCSITLLLLRIFAEMVLSIREINILTALHLLEGTLRTNGTCFGWY